MEMVKDIDVLWDIVFVICMIYGSMRDMEAKDSYRDCFPRGRIL